jgi:DNA polymerase-3 subunit alpha
MFQALDAKSIRYGLGAIKGVGRGACEAIADSRRSQGPFRDLLDFCQRVDSAKLNRRVLEALVHAGALDGLGANRASLMLQLPEVMKATEQLARERDAGQASLFGGGAMPEIRIELPVAPDWSLEQKLIGERETLGHFLSGHPLDPWQGELSTLVGSTLGDLERLFSEKRNNRGEAQVVLAGLVTAVRRRGDNQAFVQIEDTRGRLECAFFSDAFSEFAPLLSRDRIIIVEGGLREDSFNGGFSLRVRQCWDFRALCAQYGRRLALTVDLRKGDAWERLQQVMAGFRPGGTPLRLDLIARDSRGVVDLNGQNSVRSDAELITALRALSGVSQVSLAMHRPWASDR